jgi:hypothetical protein
MALPLPPETPPKSSCVGLTYKPPLPMQHVKYEFTINSIPGPPIIIPINIPEIPIYIPLPKLFDKIPKIDNDCEKAKQDMIFPGVPCDATTCSYRACRRIFGRKFCVNVPYPCPRLRGQVYLEEDNPITINLFKIPKLGLNIDANSSTNTTIGVELMSNTPIAPWNQFLNSLGSSSKTNMNDILNELMIAAGSSISSALIMMANYYVTNKVTLNLSIKLTKLILDIKWNLNYLKLYIGNREIELRNLSYTFKNIDVLKLAQAESIQLTLTNTEIVFNYILGTYEIGVNPFEMILTMIREKIAFIQSLPISEQTPYKTELNKLLDALDYIEKLTDIGELIPGINKVGLNYIKKFLDMMKVKMVVSLRFCPLTANTGVCCTIGFDLKDYLNLLGNFLKNDAKDGLNFLKKYTLIEGLGNIPVINNWNSTLNQANRTIIQGAGIVLDQIANFLQDDSKSFYGSATICAPI